MTDQTDKMTAMILALTCERDELKKELEATREAKQKAEDLCAMLDAARVYEYDQCRSAEHRLTDVNNFADMLVESLKDVLTLCAGGLKNEHAVKHARNLLEYCARVKERAERAKRESR